MGAGQWRVDAFKLKVRPGCDLCGVHHRMLLNRLGTWICVACIDSDVVEDPLADVLSPFPARNK